MTPAAAIPVLTTDRLTLRAPRRSDANAVCGFFASDRSAIIGGRCRRTAQPISGNCRVSIWAGSA